MAVESLVPKGTEFENIVDHEGSGKITKWKSPEVPQPSEEAIQAKQAELQAEYDAQEYARTRRPLYPDIGDQLDDLYKKGAFSDEMAAKIKKVKDDNPKPS